MTAPRLVTVVTAFLLTLPSTPSVLAAVEAPVFEPASCPFILPASQVEGDTVDCGYVLVPEDRSDPGSRAIRLATAIFHPPDGTRHPDAILYLEGGPGGSPLKLVGTLRDFDASFGPFLETGRDLILFDQRGVGYSEPALDCPAFSELYLDLLDQRSGDDPTRLSGEQMRGLKVESLAACADDLRLTADLDAYDTAEIAADIEDLRLALGYEQLDLWGTSYGTWPALDAMRDYPASIRSAILDAPLPPEADPYVDAPSSFIRALDEVFGACAEDTACAEAYPDLPTVFEAVVEQLDAGPVTVDILDPVRGERVNLLIDGPTYLELVFRALYQAPMRAALPRVIYDAREGIFDTLLTIAQIDVLRQGFRSWGMYFSVLCHDEVPFSSLDAFEAALDQHPQLTAMYTDFEIGPLPFELCPRWGADSAPAIENEAVANEVPALVTTGQYDPIVPPTWGQEAAATLTKVTFLLFPGLAHGVSGDPCATEVMLAFLEAPTADVDATCLTSMPVVPFDPPARADETVMFEPFSSEEAGLDGLRPAGWTELAPGQYARAASGTDPTSLVMVMLPLSLDESLALLVERFGLDEAPPALAAVTVEELDWTRYRTDTQGVAIDFAVAPTRVGTVVVVLTSTLAEHDGLVDAVLLPVVGNLRTHDPDPDDKG